jgi:hypothetical protein
VCAHSLPNGAILGLAVGCFRYVGLLHPIACSNFILVLLVPLPSVWFCHRIGHSSLTIRLWRVRVEGSIAIMILLCLLIRLLSLRWQPVLRLLGKVRRLSLRLVSLDLLVLVLALVFELVLLALISAEDSGEDVSARGDRVLSWGPSIVHSVETHICTVMLVLRVLEASTATTLHHQGSSVPAGGLVPVGGRRAVVAFLRKLRKGISRSVGIGPLNVVLGLGSRGLREFSELRNAQNTVHLRPRSSGG